MAKQIHESMRRKKKSINFKCEDNVNSAVPDWFYYKNEVLKIVNVSLISFMDLTDHNGILVTVST